MTIAELRDKLEELDIDLVCPICERNPFTLENA